MASPVPHAPAAPESLYRSDHYLWLKEQAALLRAGRLAEIDLEHIAEDLEDMARSYERELRSRLIVLLIHLLKYAFQPDHRSGDWRGQIGGQRREIIQLLKNNPGLKPLFSELLAAGECYQDAREQASLESGLPEAEFLERCPYSRDEILDPSFWPGPGPHPELKQRGHGLKFRS